MTSKLFDEGKGGGYKQHDYNTNTYEVPKSELNQTYKEAFKKYLAEALYLAHLLSTKHRPGSFANIALTKHDMSTIEHPIPNSAGTKLDRKLTERHK